MVQYSTIIRNRIFRPKADRETSRKLSRYRTDQHRQTILFNSYRSQTLSSQVTHPQTNYILGHTSVNKQEMAEITSCVLSDHNGIKLTINCERSYKKSILKIVLSIVMIPFLKRKRRSFLLLSNMWNISILKIEKLNKNNGSPKKPRGKLKCSQT